MKRLHLSGIEKGPIQVMKKKQGSLVHGKKACKLINWLKERVVGQEILRLCLSLPRHIR